MTIKEREALRNITDRLRLLPEQIGIDDDASVRVSIATALGATGVKSAIDRLIMVLSDQSESVRVGAARALGAIGTSEVIEPLVHLVRHARGKLRKAACPALAETKSEAALQPLLRALDYKDRDVADLAVFAVASIQSNSSDVEATLIEVVKQYGRWGRSMAIRKLGSFGTDAALETLIHGLKSKKLDDQKKELIEAIVECDRKSRHPNGIIPLSI